jgi:hypothetical protein
MAVRLTADLLVFGAAIVPPEYELVKCPSHLTSFSDRPILRYARIDDLGRSP